MLISLPHLCGSAEQGAPPSMRLVSDSATLPKDAGILLLTWEDDADACSEHDFQPDSIGALTRPVELAAWETRVRKRFAFLADLDTDEQRWAACDERHLREVATALAALRS